MRNVLASSLASQLPQGFQSFIKPGGVGLPAKASALAV